ncbi:MAG: DMT family transporter [Alphaproteobacteria bacterium]|nr:DMT family transporter [Alphaproteobacteria bacterium]
MSQSAKPMTGLEWGLLILLAIIWGGSFFLTETGLAGFGPLSFAAGRVILAAAALWVVAVAFGLPLRLGAGTFAALGLMGLLNNAIPFSLIAWGQVRIDSSLASILNGATPLFGVIFAHFLTRDEKMTPSKLAGVALGFLGVAVLFGPSALAGQVSENGVEAENAFSSSAIALGQAAVIGATVSYALAGIFGRRFRTLSPIVASAGMLTGGGLILTPAALLVEDPIRTASWTLVPILSVIGIALLCTSVAYLLYFRILATAGATNLLLVTLLVPVSATALGVAFLGESLTLNALAGVALIGLGLAFVDGRAPRAAVVKIRRIGDARRASR